MYDVLGWLPVGVSMKSCMTFRS
nr:hypothetical protein [Spirosoma endbachense]